MCFQHHEQRRQDRYTYMGRDGVTNGVPAMEIGEQLKGGIAAGAMEAELRDVIKLLDTVQKWKERTFETNCSSSQVVVV